MHHVEIAINERLVFLEKNARRFVNGAHAGQTPPLWLLCSRAIVVTMHVTMQ